MKITFWGTRGSIPCSLNPSEYHERISEIAARAKDSAELQREGVDSFLSGLPQHLRHSYGGNTSCLEITDGDDRLILDGGSGLRELGSKLLREKPKKGSNLNFLFSHTHWDHICGIPFFIPLYMKNSTINIHGGHDDLKKRFEMQHQHLNFPVDFSELNSTINFIKLPLGKKTEINGFTITAIRQYHPGGSFGYRIEKNGKVLVYSTDAEFQNETEEGLKDFTDFMRGADVLVFDAMYSFNETLEKVDWGHSSSRVGIKICKLAEINKLVLFHHDPECSDKKLHENYLKTLELKEKILGSGNSLEIINSYDSLELEI